MTVTETQTTIFEFTGNNLCLDFCNTLNDRFLINAHELLTGYDRLLLWGQEANILTEDEALRLGKEAKDRNGEAEAVLNQAIELREALFRLLLANIQGTSPEGADLETFNSALTRAMAQTRIVPQDQSYSWNWLPKENALDRMLWPVVRSAADLLTTEQLEDLRVCASDICSWLFLDQSKNHTRRWCDMKSCGNRAKARKHYSQKKQAS
jgi:predicted RNA-binding Zn ribbon-like protein